MPKECYKCESQFVDYKIDGQYYCEDCAWELAKELDMDVDDDTVTIYKIGEEYIEDDREEAIECAFDYLNMKIEKV